MGVAMSRSSLELYRQYGADEPAIPEIWSVWNSLMGDPATDIWLGIPSELDVSYPAIVPAGATAIPVTVTSGGAPVAGAHVAAFQADHLRSVARTDAAGQVLLPLAGAVDGTARLTVSGHNLLPYRGFFALGDQEHWVALGLALSMLLLLMSRRAHPADDRRLVPLYLGLSAAVCAIAWSGLLIGLYVAGRRAVGAQ